MADQLRGLLRRTPESALHVHVGLPDERAAAQAFNAIRLQVPLLVGLAANSPFWFGTDSGLRSARYVLSRAYPGRCVPRAVRDIEDLEQLAAETLTAAGLPDATFLWWDLRMHPRHGTLELREMDTQSSLEHVGGDRRARAGAGHRGGGRAGSRSTSRARRSTGRPSAPPVTARTRSSSTARSLARSPTSPARRCAAFGRIARELGDEDALDGIEKVLEENGAARQCAAFARGGMPGLLRTLADETAQTPVAARRT